MKDPFRRTKVVIRRLPPAISQAATMEQIDSRFAGRYKWFSFRPGKNSQKDMRHSRLYINFNGPEDVVEFAEFFDGHTFVNEKGSQYKALVEYAASQHVPKPCSKKDGREGAINKDPEYLEFLELISKPAETLPSAEIQLERKEAGKAGVKETLVVTPLMEFVRQKRATKNGFKKLSTNGKLARRSVSISSSGLSSKCVSEKRKALKRYVLKDCPKGGIAKDKSAYILVSRKEEQKIVDKYAVASSSKKIALTTDLTATAEQNQRHDAGGRLIRGILSNKDVCQRQSYAYGAETEQQTRGNLEKKRPPRPPNMRLIPRELTSTAASVLSVSDTNGKMSADDKSGVKYSHGSLPSAERFARRLRNKDRPDRGVWAPLRRSEVPSVACSTVSVEGGSNLQQDDDTGGRGSFSPPENGSHRYVTRRGLAHGSKDRDGSLFIYDGKPPKKVLSSDGPPEKQVWVQKSGS